MKPSVETDKSRMLKALGITNNCPVAKKCGGCSYAGKTYFEQTAAKEKLVKSLISPFYQMAEDTTKSISDYFPTQNM